MRKALPLLLALVLLLCACGGAPGFTASAEEPAPYEKDYAYLWEQLEESYPYLPYLRSRGLDTEEIRTRYARELPQIQNDGAFLLLLNRMFSELGRFAHLDAIGPEAYRMYRSVFLEDEESAALPFTDGFRKVLLDERLSSLYQADGEHTQAQQDAARLPRAAVFYYPDCKALHLRLPSFSQELVARDRNLVADALARYPEAEHILFDITGNTGGSDLYWLENLVAPFGCDFTFEYRQFYRASPLFDRYYADLDTVAATELADVPLWVEDLGLNRAILSTVTMPEANGGQAVACPAQRWLVADGAVFSAADKFAAFCAATGWARVVGRRTAGDGLGLTPVLLLLPESGVLVRFAITAGENPDGSMNAARGTAPEILSIRDQLPLDRCLAQIRGG